MKVTIKEKSISKIFKVLSIFLVLAFAINLIPVETALAKKQNYTVVEKYDDGYALVKSGKKLGIVNKSGKETLQIKYDDIIRETYDDTYRDTFFINIGEKWGIANKNGTILIPISYSEITQTGEKFYKVGKKDEWGDIKYGIIDRKKNKI